ncbi:hypothetical protein niasHT_014271 [Heterodera trifolii]|uniref:Histone-lysine N-methyltransferase n=1 Tax=Heterodera trifolii TaxID=157864 RepID=A0ABD2LK95_9BILA
MTSAIPTEPLSRWENEDEIIEINMKPIVSKLRERVRYLTNKERQKLSSLVEKCYHNFLSGKSDEFPDEANENLKDIQHSMFEYPSKAVMGKVFDYYHNLRKAVADILSELSLEPFDFVAALCNSIWTPNNKGDSAIDLSRAIKFRHLGEYQLILLVDFLINREQITKTLIILEFSILPSDALLMLTLIWSELERPAVARKFEAYLSCPSPTNETEEDYKRTDEQFHQMLNEHLKQYEHAAANERNWKILLEHYVTDFKKEFEQCSENANRIRANLTEIHHSICKLPQLQVETVVSDSSNSEENLDESNCEISISTKKGLIPKWARNELSQANLENELRIQIGQFCFAPKDKLCKSETKNCEFGFVKCMLKRKLEDDQFEVQMAHRESADSEKIVVSFHAVSLSELSLGEAPSVRCPEGTRVVALSELAERQLNVHPIKYFSGTIGVKPFTQNRFEYLVFFDNGIDEYVRPEDIRLLTDQPTDQSGKFQPRQAHTKVESTNPAKANFLRQYFNAYPDWPLIQLKKLENTQRIMAIRNGVKESAFVLDVDRQLSLLRFPGTNKVAWPLTKNAGRDCVNLSCREHSHVDEWVYRGNADRFPTLAQAQHNSGAKDAQKPSSWRIGSRFSSRKLPSSHFEMAFPQQSLTVYHDLDMTSEAIRTQTAKKSSSKMRAISFEGFIQIPTHCQMVDANFIERKRISEKMVDHCVALPRRRIYRPSPIHCDGNANCSSACLNGVEFVPLSPKCGKIFSPFLAPMLFGWNRMLIKIRTENGSKKMGIRSKRVQYGTPCGIRLNAIEQVAEYLRRTKFQQAKLSIDMFSFDPQIRPEIVAKPFDEKSIQTEDFTKGEESVPISLVNAIDVSKIDPNFVYRPRRTGIKRMQNDEGAEQSIDPCFCSGCSCTDDCADSKTCECRRLTAVAHERLSKSLQIHKACVKGYNFRRLDDKIISGIYECNSLCKCSKSTCYNRVVQQDIKIPLQLFMTADKGWGVRTLVDIPQGAFVCTYSGEILDENVAESQGKAISDIYLAELDLIKVVEGAKEEQGIDLISDEGIDEGSEDNEDGPLPPPQQENVAVPTEDEAYFEPNSGEKLVGGVFEDAPSAIDEEMANEFALRAQPSTSYSFSKTVKQNKSASGAEKSAKKTKVPPMKLDEFCEYFGEDFTYLIDAAKMGNIGRFLNHSCDPNCHVQHCLVDTHDLRMPWCAFFTKKLVKAGEELCWDYAYEIGSVERQVNCKCGTTVCRGRLL